MIREAALKVLHRPGTRKLALSASSVAFVAFIAVSVDRAGALSFAMVLTATFATVAVHRMFPESWLFSVALTNLIGIYAAIFVLFADEVFGRINQAVLSIGFMLPVATFLAGCWMRRPEVRAALEREGIRDHVGLLGATLWLVPIALVGVAVFVLSHISQPLMNNSIAFLGAMAAIGVIVLAVSPDVAIFMVDVGLLFEAFFRRISRLVIPAFAFLTFYLMMVIFFASLYSLISQYSSLPHFRSGVGLRSLSFAESVYFSLTTLSTVGYGDIVPASNLVRFIASAEVVCGVMLLMFGVYELLEYAREHLPREQPRREHASDRKGRGKAAK